MTINAQGSASKRHKQRKRGYACDSWWLRREMQDQDLCVRGLVVLCEERMPQIAALHEGIHPMDTIEEARIHEMLREQHRFDEDLYIKVAGGLGLADHWCLTRRNRVTYRLESAQEKNALIGLQRLILMLQLPSELYSGQSCLLEHLHGLRGSWPPEFGQVRLDYQSLVNVVEALCPAGLCIKRGNGFYLTRPSTEEMLKRTKTRSRRLSEAIDDLFDQDYGDHGTHHYRRSIGEKIKENAQRLAQKQSAIPYDDEDYAAYDLDWQIELFSGGDAVLYQEMLNLTPSCRQTNSFLVSQHARQPALPFDEDFALPLEDWKYKWNEANTALVMELARLLHEKATTADQLKSITNEIIAHTILNIKAVDNALERHRKKTNRPVRYPNLKWQMTGAVTE